MVPRINYKQRMATLWQRPSNRMFYARWEEYGKSRKVSLRTRDEAKANARFRDFERRLMAGKIKPLEEGVKKLFFDFVSEFLEHVEATTSTDTYRLYDDALKKAKLTIGNIPINHINARHIDKCITDMSRERLKPPTINKNLRHIKSALNKAYAWEYRTAPIRNFPKMLQEEKELRFLTVEQIRALIGAITSDREFSDMCLFSAYTGLRSGELIRLTWCDVDHPEGFLRVTAKQKNRKESSIPINKNARVILERRSHGLSESDKVGKVFRFGCLTWISQKSKAACVKAGIPDTRFHDLRHTFASHLAMAGTNIKTIQELMRHKSIQSTMIYANVSPEHLREASEKLNYGPMPVASQAAPANSRPCKRK